MGLWRILMPFVVPGLAAEVAQLPANGGKAGEQFSYRERALLASVKAYVDSLPAGSVTLAELSAGIAPSHVVKFAGSITASGASATQVATVTGVLATDLVFVTIKSQAGVISVKSGAATLNTVTVVGSGAFTNGDVIGYQVIRAAV
jgi:hypothetical protein